MSAMPPTLPLPPGPLAVRVKEPSVGLFYWVVTQLSTDERSADVRIEGSDHPYPTHEAALHAGSACLKALKASTFQPQGPH